MLNSMFDYVCLIGESPPSASPCREPADKILPIHFFNYAFARGDE